jgi:O-methyltransferase domain/Dimerisation domain
MRPIEDGRIGNLGSNTTFAMETARMSQQPTPEKILQTGLAFWPAKTLLSAIEMGVFTELAKGPETYESLRGRLGLHSRSARDFLDTLVALGFLQRSGDTYSNTTETNLFLDRRKPSYVGGILEMANHRLYPFWGNLTEGLRTGLPQNEVKSGGPGLFETLYADPARLKEFLAAMTGLSHGTNLTIAKNFPWKDYRTFVDVGTAQGDLAAQIARANPHLRGCGFDLPEVAPIFEEYIAEVGVADRVRFAPGSFFDHDLPKADVVLMGHILHDWDLPTKKMLIRKAFDAVPKGGAFVVYEAVIDDDRSKNAFGLMMSLNMLIETPGGFDYTGADCSGWMMEAGFSSTHVEPLVGPDSMVVGIK